MKLPRDPGRLDFKTEKVKNTEWLRHPKPYLKARFRRHTTSAETHYLYHLATEVPEGGRVLDAGTMHGGSSVTLGHGMKSGRLYTVDLFELHPDSDKQIAVAVPGRLKEYFRENLPDVQIRIHKGDSADFAQQVNDTFNLVFIDGDHSEEGCRRDWAAWGPKVEPGGVVVFHDCHFDGVAEVISEINPVVWERERQIFSMVAFRRK